MRNWIGWMSVVWRVAVVLLVGGVRGIGAEAQAPASKVLYATGFEVSEGFDPKFRLVGQAGWGSFGSGGNGLVTNFFTGRGQHAFIGFTPPAPKDDYLNLLYPVNVTRFETNLPVVRFQVTMEIVDSKNGLYDDFRWAVYNADGNRLFSIDFDNSSLEISYALDSSTNFISSGLRYQNGLAYELTILMNFARNRWSAYLNDAVVAHEQPMTTTGLPLTLGDIDAAWLLRALGAPGDNYMVFDDYWITAEPPPQAPQIRSDGMSADKRFLFRVFGQPDRRYVLEDSLTLKDWVPLLTNSAPASGILEFFDDPKAGEPKRFFRARLLEP